MSDEQPIDLDTYRKLIDADRKARVAQAAAEVEAVLDKHRCRLEALVTFGPSGVDRRCVIVAQE